MPVGNVPVISLVMDWVFAAGLTGECSEGSVGKDAAIRVAAVYHPSAV